MESNANPNPDHNPKPNPNLSLTRNHTPYFNPDANSDGVSETAHRYVLLQPSLQNVKDFHRHFHVTGQPIMQPSDTKVSTLLPDVGIKLQHTWKSRQFTQKTPKLKADASRLPWIPRTRGFGLVLLRGLFEGAGCRCVREKHATWRVTSTVPRAGIIKFCINLFYLGPTQCVD